MNILRDISSRYFTSGLFAPFLIIAMSPLSFYWSGIGSWIAIILGIASIPLSSFTIFYLTEYSRIHNDTGWTRVLVIILINTVKLVLIVIGFAFIFVLFLTVLLVFYPENAQESKTIPLMAEYGTNLLTGLFIWIQVPIHGISIARNSSGRSIRDGVALMFSSHWIHSAAIPFTLVVIFLQQIFTGYLIQFEMKTAVILSILGFLSYATFNISISNLVVILSNKTSE